MPIDREEFEIAKAPLKDRVLDLLRRNSEKAFTLNEIFTQVEGFADVYEARIAMLAALASSHDPTKEYREILAELVETGEIESASYHGNEFYAARKEA